MFTIKDVPRSFAQIKSLVRAGADKSGGLGQAEDADGQRARDRAEEAAGKVEVIRIRTRRLDGGTCLQIRPLLSAAWKRGARTVVIDLSDVVFIDSLGISALISEQRRRPEGARIVVSSLGDFVRDVFEVTQLFQIFDVFASAEAAVASLAA
jgi:anti-sigma B factor antagonist